jgi:hypothetical protein
MKLFLKLTILLISLMPARLLPAQEAELNPPEIKTILKKMSSAIDPSRKLANASSMMIQIENVIESKGIKSRLTACFVNPDKYRSDSKLGMLPLESRGFNGQTFWKKNAIGAVSKLSGTAVEPMRFLVSFMNPGARFDKIFTKIVWDKKKYKLNNFDCAMLTCYPPPELKLPPYIIYVDRANWFIRRTEITAPEFGRNMKVVTDFYSYGAYNGVNLPAEYAIYFPGATLKSKTAGMNLNVNPSADFFDVPASGF